MNRPFLKPDTRNVQGDFYVECDSCLVCGAPEAQAPDLIVTGENSCYFIKQPTTVNEIDRAIDAMAVSCVDCVRYKGTDRIILEKIYARGLMP